ncbi:MAG: hypothetical protein CMN84_06985 [Spongiibacteraceae bacterium]|jgi:carnitine monooxygenase subunit|nr:hypothetical protein [Spongiibacteraceae bacterium]
MTPEENRQLIKRMLQHLTAGTTDLAPQSMVIPAEEFLSTERFQQEREQLFLDTPQAIGFSGELPGPNTYLTATVLHIPVLVTRLEDGSLRAFLNACAHRGAPVAAGCGEAKRLTCKFHGWSYGLNGCLAGRRSESSFDDVTASTDLVPLPVAERCGLILVGARTSVSQHDVDTALADIEPVMTGFHLEQAVPVGSYRYEAKANWKLVAGLSHEAYHFASVHRDSLASLMYDKAVVDTFGRHTRWAFAFRGAEKLADTDPELWPNHFPGAMNHTLFPGTVIVVNNDDAEMIRVEPGGSPGESVIYYSGVSRRPENLEACREAFEFGGKLFNEEDLPAAEASQRGLAAGLPSVIVGRNEPVVQFWHELWNQQLRKHQAAG